MENAPITVVRNFDDVFGDGEISSPIGLTFVPGANVFLTQSANSSGITAITSTGEEINTRFSVNLPASIKGINFAFNPQSNRLLSLNPGDDKLTEITLDSNNDFSRATTEEIDVRFLDIQNAQGISVTPNGTLYVLDGMTKEILCIEQSANSVFQESWISKIELPTEINNPKGIAFNSTTNNLHVFNFSSQELFELSQQGEIVAMRDLSSLGIRQPQAFIFAPSGDLTDAPEQLNLYVADGAPNSGGIFELSLEGSDVGPRNPREDINAAWIDSNGEIYLSNDGAFNVPSASDDSSEIFSFAPDALGLILMVLLLCFRMTRKMVLT